jgi:hypothetical protein
LRIGSAVSLVDVGAVDRAAGGFLGSPDDIPQGMTVVRIARHRLSVQHELASRGATLVVTIEAFTPNS